MTTTAAFNFIITALFVWCGLYGIYFAFIRATILTRFRFYIHEVRDGLDLLLISGKIKETDPALEIVRHRACTLENSLGQLAVTNILLAISHGRLRSTDQVENENAIIAASHEELVKLNTKMNMAALGSFCANSPFLMAVSVVLVCGAALWSAVAQTAKRKITNSVWNAIYIREWTSEHSEIKAYA
jgi:hypothetical protein